MHTVQRSNQRSEIQLLFRVLSYGVESWDVHPHTQNVPGQDLVYAQGL